MNPGIYSSAMKFNSPKHPDPLGFALLHPTYDSAGFLGQDGEEVGGGHGGDGVRRLG
jgi:hypothetical protein